MNIQIFEKDIPLTTILVIVGDGFLIFFSVVLAAHVHFGGIPSYFFSFDWLFKALLITGVCQICLYYNDLYNVRVSDTYLELTLRLTKALGVASVILSLTYYLFPGLIIGRGIFFVALFFRSSQIAVKGLQKKECMDRFFSLLKTKSKGGEVFLNIKPVAFFQKVLQIFTFIFLLLFLSEYLKGLKDMLNR